MPSIVSCVVTWMLTMNLRNDMIAFKCKVCGKEHKALHPEEKSFTSFEIEERKAKWCAVERKHNEARVVEEKDRIEQLEKAEQKAWMSYMETKSNNVSRLPDTITTKKDRDGFYFVCKNFISCVMNAYAEFVGE